MYVWAFYISLRSAQSLTGRPRFYTAGPYVTSVGGTTGGRDEYHPEQGASLSQGGFSLLFERPPYQKDAVPPFFKQLGGRYSGLYKCACHRDLNRTVLTL